MSKNKKTIIIVITFTAIITLLFYTHSVFNTIEKENAPYLSNKEQMKGVFYSNIEKFKRFAELAKDYDENSLPYIHYDIFRGSSAEAARLSGFLNNDELVNAVVDIGKNAHMNEFYIFDESILIFQSLLDNEGWISVGVRYTYASNEWDYYYSHNYEICLDLKKIFYKVYDLLYNSSETLYVPV